MNKEKTTVRAVRQQWDARIELFKKTMGWEDGHCKNLSGFEGDLSEPDATIKMILNEIQEEEERKKVMQNDAKHTLNIKFEKIESAKTFLRIQYCTVHCIHETVIKIVIYCKLSYVIKTQALSEL